MKGGDFMKIRYLILLVLVLVVALPMTAFANDYDYNIYATDTSHGYATPPIYRYCGYGSNEWAWNQLVTNTSDYPIYFRVAYLDTWTYATAYCWQSACPAVTGTHQFDYYSPSFTDKKGDYELFFRRDTRDTYSGTRHVVGTWTAE